LALKSPPHCKSQRRLRGIVKTAVTRLEAAAG
jgi:hypothetical protein